MLSWITGPRGNAVEGQQQDTNSDSTYIEPPETPAPVFAVRAFKHAIFGTPAPPETIKRMEKQKKPDIPTTKPIEFAKKKEAAPQFSPSKPNGILMTPGTAARKNKTVTFGSQVVDNEGKRGQPSKSGIPNDCPGKFPSPWTPGTELRADPTSDKKPRTKLTEALYDARSKTITTTTTTTVPVSIKKVISKDDIDLTLDMSTPRSESGKYWKEQYESYAAKTSLEMKKLVAKQQLAKTYAKKKDGEAMELAARLQEERKRFRLREVELEAQNKEYQERLRQAMAENSRASIEMAALRKRIEAIEAGGETKDEQDNKSSTFQIFEDVGNESVSFHPGNDKATAPASTDPFVELPSIILGKPMANTSIRKPPTGKENSPPKARHVRRSTLPHRSPRDATAHSIFSSHDAEKSTTSALPTKSPLSRFEAEHRTPLSTKSAGLKRESQIANQSILSSPLPTKSPSPVKETSHPKPAHTPPRKDQETRPASPDPWLDVESSPFPQTYNRMALPIASAPIPSHHKPSRPVATKLSKPTKHNEKDVDNTTTMSTGWNAVNKPTNATGANTSALGIDKTDGPSAFVLERERSKIPRDRKEDAKRRLEERKKLRLQKR